MCKSEASLARECKKHIIPLVFEEIKPWPPQGLGITFTDLLYLNVPGGNLDSLTFQKLSGDILKFVKPSSWTKNAKHLFVQMGSFPPYFGYIDTNIIYKQFTFVWVSKKSIGLKF